MKQETNEVLRALNESLLYRPSDSTLRQQHELEELIDQFQKCEPKSEGLQKLAVKRMMASSTLGRGKEEWSKWDLGNQFIAEKIMQNISPSIKRISKLNFILTSGKSKIRDHRIYAADLEFISPKSLPIALEIFENQLLKNIKNGPPLLGSYLCYLWLISLHPFTDGNGRTSRLLADWILIASGLLPISFANSAISHVAVTKKNLYIDHDAKYSNFLNAVKSSYEICFVRF